MKSHQRKAKIRRARQHQAYCKSASYKAIKRHRLLDEWKRYNDEFEAFERECDEQFNAEKRQRLTLVMIGVIGWVLINLAWMMEKMA